jgi:uncharacterized protein
MQSTVGSGVPSSRRRTRKAVAATPATPPFTTFVVKIFELCNLNCSYCYVYNLADQSYRTRPVVMSSENRDALAERLGEHAERHSLPYVVVVLHGGEPLLAGKRYVEEWITAVREIIGSRAYVLVRLQTNGILLDGEWADLLYRHQVRVGISIDGPVAYHDEFRVDHKGLGSFDRVVAGLERLKAHPRCDDVFGAILSVANPNIPAAELWQFWLDLGVTRFDINLPHHNHDHPPLFTETHLTSWLIELFELWWAKDDPRYEVRFFRNIVNLILGSPVSTDYIGGKPGGIAVVETDGAIQASDALKACADGLVSLGLFISSNSFDEALTHPLIRLGNHSSSQLSLTCRRCDAREVCGGGYLPHRFSSARQFDNPSVYCESLYALLHHVRNRVSVALGRPQG